MSGSPSAHGLSWLSGTDTLVGLQNPRKLSRGLRPLLLTSPSCAGRLVVESPSYGRQLEDAIGPWCYSRLVSIRCYDAAPDTSLRHSVWTLSSCQLCYGYRVVRTMTGTAVSTGDREVEPADAAIVEQIFREFVSGRSPKQIAKTLNQQGVTGPFGGKWSPSTVYGHAKRGTGIPNSELYVGRMVWNRLRYVKNPDWQACRG
jgi:hypothetical protein